MPVLAMQAAKPKAFMVAVLPPVLGPGVWGEGQAQEINQQQSTGSMFDLVTQHDVTIPAGGPLIDNDHCQCLTGPNACVPKCSAGAAYKHVFSSASTTRA